MSFVPAFFSKFGRTANDLLTLKFDVGKDDFKDQASIKTSAKNFSVTSSCVRDSEQLQGKVVMRCDTQNFDNTTEYHSQGRIKNTIRSSKLYRGLVLAYEAELQKTKAESPFGHAHKVTAEYAQDGFAGSVEFNSKRNAFLTSAVLGMDGVSVGAAAVVDLNKLAKEGASPQDALLVDGGIQYENGNIVATTTVQSNKTVAVSLFHRVSGDFQVGTKFVVPGDDSSNSALSAGLQYKVNPSTVVKGRASIFSDQSYVLYGYVQHRLANPNLTIGVSTMRNSSDKYEVGFNVAFGEY